MTIAIKKLIENIDQLVCWLNKYPNTPIPSHEKSRVVAILNKVSKAEEINAQEWEIFKPKPIPNRIPSTITVGKTLNPITPRTSSNSVSFRNHDAAQIMGNLVDVAFIIQHGKKMIICSDCGCPVLPKNLERHKKKCKPIKGRVINTIAGNLDSKKRGRNINTSIKTPNDYKEERRLDGSYGYHTFSLEKNRFGSHPSFDNMGDEAHP